VSDDIIAIDIQKNIVKDIYCHIYCTQLRSDTVQLKYNITKP